MSPRRPLRRPLIGGNWKMHLTSEEAMAFCRDLIAGLGAAAPADVVLFPSHPLLPVTRTAIADSPLALGGQDLHSEDSGAHTGDVSGAQLADAGCAWVLCGHSERRRDHAETDELVALKAAAALRHELRPLVCVGERLEERRADRTEELLREQLRPLLDLAPNSFDLAYEPVWAIGTGETATPEQAAAAHAFLRGRVDEAWGTDAAQRMRIVYGGSVKPGNAAELIEAEEVDGFLVGGASLDADTFLAIIEAGGG